MSRNRIGAKQASWWSSQRRCVPLMEAAPQREPEEILRASGPSLPPHTCETEQLTETLPDLPNTRCHGTGCALPPRSACRWMMETVPVRPGEELPSHPFLRHWKYYEPSTRSLSTELAPYPYAPTLPEEAGELSCQ